MTLEGLEHLPSDGEAHEKVETEAALARLYSLIHRLKAPDRQVMTLYLEDLSAEAIGEVTGLTPGAIATRISRLKALLARHFHEAGHD